MSKPSTEPARTWAGSATRMAEHSKKDGETLNEVNEAKSTCRDWQKWWSYALLLSASELTDPALLKLHLLCYGMSTTISFNSKKGHLI